MGLPLATAGNTGGAADGFSDLVSNSPSASSHAFLANLLAAQGRIPEAIVHYEQALRLDPSLLGIRNQLGRALLAVGRLPEAAGAFAEVVGARRSSAPTSFLDPPLPERSGGGAGERRRAYVFRSYVVLPGRTAYSVADDRAGQAAAAGAATRMRSITDIGPSTKLCALIGNPVEHSMSPAIHNRAFAELGLDYVYLAFRVEDVGAAVAGMRALENFRGLSVTIPHKMSILKYLDEVAEVDRGIGSINTVVKDGERLKGFGSDGPGALKALSDAGVRVRGKQVTILGSGGAARAIAFSLAAQAEPRVIHLLGVIEPELKALRRDLAKTGVQVTSALLDPRALEERLGESQVLIQCTPVGMHPETGASLVPKSLLHRSLAVMDIVYNPLKTKLLADAEARGLKTISGAEMFVNQAVIQFELWTGKKAPREVMRDVVLRHLGKGSRKP